MALHLYWRRVGVLAATVVAVGLVRVVLVPPERCGDQSAASMRRTMASASEWFERAEKRDGTWVYLYDADTGRELDGYNVVRHAGVMMSLYQVAAGLEDSDPEGSAAAAERADHGLDYVLDHLIERSGWTALSGLGRVQLGSNALVVAALMQRRAATDDPQYDELARSIGRFLLAQ